MATKVRNCGNYKCTHCAGDGHCCIGGISIGPDGKCICFSPDLRFKSQFERRVEETDPNSNAC